MKNYLHVVKVFFIALILYIIFRELYIRYSQYDNFSEHYAEYMSEKPVLPGLQGLDKNFLKLLNPGKNMESFYGYVPNFSSKGVHPADTEKTELMGESLREGLMMKDNQTDRGVWWSDDGETPYAIGSEGETVG